MKSAPFNPNNPAGFITQDHAAFRSKLDRFAAAGPAGFYLLIDFDRTLTTSKHTGDNTTTWQILHNLLPEQGQRTSDQIRDKYLALEALGPLSHEDSKHFSISVLELHTTHRTNRQAIEQASKQIKLRDGCQQLFLVCEAKAIPTVILSAGIGDIIEHITHSNHIRPTKVLSTKLEFDTDGQVVGWRKESLVLTHNKGEHVNRFLPNFKTERPLTILLGDTVGDAHILEGDDTVLRIRVSDLKNESTLPAYQQESFAAGYDAIIEDDLFPLALMIQWLTDQGAEDA